MFVNTEKSLARSQSNVPVARCEISKDNLAALGPISRRLYALVGFVFLFCFGLEVAKPGDSA
jgi:hypothetical protein